MGLDFFESCVDQCLRPLSEFVEPCAFWDGNLVALAFTGLTDLVVNVNKSMIAEDCTFSHLSPDFGVASKHCVGESFGAFFNVLVIPTDKGWDSPVLSKVGF